MATTELSLFSIEILGLVGRAGAGPHDLRRMAQRGRMLAWAGESQHYTEPKRLARLGYLEAHKEPGLGADIVTADCRLLHASDEENAELMWGLRGGGGNFGIVTSLEYRVHPVGPTVLAGAIFYPGERAAEIYGFYREWTSNHDGLQPGHGAARAFPTRGLPRAAPFLLNIVSRTPSADGYHAAVAWAQKLYAAMEPAQTGGTYVNFLSAEGEDRTRAAYRETSYDRLVALKDRYDPTNLFRLNHNIRPSGG